LAQSTLFLILSLFACTVLAQRAQADMSCKHTGKEFIYDCTFHIKREAKALSGLTVVVGADMPSMPMAHNVAPVKAKPGKTPGEYLARLDLEMPGEWAVKLRLSGPVRDLLVLHYNFRQ
jgi:YtkA-like